MKVKFLYSLAMAGLLLGACSSHDDIVEAPVVDNAGPAWNAEGTGYVNLAIKLPTTPASVRGVNDNFDDGTADEYAVKNATLILFADGNVASAYDLSLEWNLEGTSTDAITSTAKITQQINQTTAKNIEALVVLNHNNLFSVNSATAQLMVGSSDMTGKTLDQLNDSIKKQIGINYAWHSSTNGFLMSNALLAISQGGSQAPTSEDTELLTVIDPSKIYETKEEADANPAANIYVERAEAKVTVAAQDDGTVSDGTSLTYKIEGWCLDNTNKTNKLVRTNDGYSDWYKLYSNSTISTLLNPYRFVGSAAIGKSADNSKTLYRVYWGEDYNYDSNQLDAFVTVGGDAIANSDLATADGTTPLYCFENTMDVTNMIEENITRVIVKAKFNEGTGFYTIDGYAKPQDATSYYTADNVKAIAAARVILDKDVAKAISDNLIDESTEFDSSTDLEIGLSIAKAGKIVVTSIDFTDAGKAKFTNVPTITADWVTAANNRIAINYYENGSAYYSAYIAHFGDELTPWNNGEYPVPEVSNSYPSTNAATNYLGRWGVLRNNWYQISVTGIKSLGSPVVETVTKNPVDTKDAYISFRINILPWAVRTQSVTLK